MSAVVAGSYYESVPDADRTLFRQDKVIVVDSKVLMLGLQDREEAYYVCGILNAEDIVAVIDGYAISTNRGVDVLRYLAIPPFDREDPAHRAIAELSGRIHQAAAALDGGAVQRLERELNAQVRGLFA